MELQYSTRDLARAAVIAAAYAALAWISNFFGLAFPAIQFRLSEALCVLPCRDRKAAIPGLAVGCLITNLLSPYGLLDLVVGTLATLLAAVWSGRCRSAWTAAVPPVVCNAVIVGAMLAWESTGISAAFAGLFAYNALTVGIGEAAVCFLLGAPLLRALEKRGALVLDCDAVYHEMLRTDAPLCADLTAAFGDVFAPDGGLDRQKLGNIVFGDAGALAQLDAIIFRHLPRALARRMEESGARLIALDAIKLVESGLGALCDVTVAVTAPEEVRVRRIMTRDGISEDYARARVRAQRSEEDFRADCDAAFENNYPTPAQTAFAAEEFLDTIIKKSKEE